MDFAFLLFEGEALDRHDDLPCILYTVHNKIFERTNTLVGGVFRNVI